MMRIVVLPILVAVATAAILQHALIWHRPKMIEMSVRGEYPEYVGNRNGTRFPSIFKQRVFKCGSFEYVGNITIGSPDQEFTVILDTGSANLWVTGSQCVHCFGVPSEGKRKFESNSSSTFVESNKTWSITYVSGYAAGVFGTDTVKFGGLNEEQLIVPNTTFGLANNLSSRLANEGIDGILGLGLPPLAYAEVVPPLMNAITQGLLEQALFTFWMQPRVELGRKTEGLVTYGAIDVTNCGNVIAFEKLTSETFYQFKMSAIGIGNYTLRKNYEVSSDTGASVIAGPVVVIDLFAKIIGAVHHDNCYIIRCNATLPLLHIIIGENDYAVDPFNYIIYLGQNWCVLAMLPHRSGGFGASWVLGHPFIRNYCTIYDIGRRRIGFAQSLIK